jgi:hypothetical protein
MSNCKDYYRSVKLTKDEHLKLVWCKVCNEHSMAVTVDCDFACENEGCTNKGNSVESFMDTFKVNRLTAFKSLKSHAKYLFNINVCCDENSEYIDKAWLKIMDDVEYIESIQFCVQCSGHFGKGIGYHLMISDFGTDHMYYLLNCLVYALTPYQWDAGVRYFKQFVDLEEFRKEASDPEFINKFMEFNKKDSSGMPGIRCF